jgi:predicted MFS family arabinose efflux permease
VITTTVQAFERHSWLKYYVLALLFATSIIGYIDRQVLTILLESIRTDLHFTDTQMGALAGVFFSGTYILAGIPLARLADFGIRRSIIAGCMAVWSAGTALCGVAQNYTHLAAARMLVGIGEAGSSPASYSLLADIYPQHRRARVFSVVSCGNAVGLAFGLFLAGSLNQLLGWRNVFIVVGLPGLLFAALIRITVPEPVRPPVDTRAGPKPSLLDSLRGLFRLTTYRWLIFVVIFASTTAYAVLAWMPTFLIRVHQMPTSAVGLKMGIATVVGLLLGNLSAGALADRLARADIRWLIWVAGFGLLACIPMALISFSWRSDEGAILFLTLYMYFMGFWSPPLVTAAVSLVDNHSRALAASTIPIVQSLGGALGPFLVGASNDHVFQHYGRIAIRYSITFSLVGALISGLAALAAGNALAREYKSFSRREPILSAH